MGTFDIPIEKVTAAVLQDLVDGRVREDLQLEYKETLPTAGDVKKGREFFAGCA